jgi:putative DNA primase/helicase
MEKEEHLFIKINKPEENTSKVSLFNGSQLVESKQIKNDQRSSKNIHERKEAAISDSKASNLNFLNKLDINVKALSKKEADLSTTYYNKHKSAAKRNAKKHLLNEYPTRNKEDDGNNTGSKQPIDYVITAHFLEHNIVKSFAGRVRLYDPKYGYFKELNELELHIAIKDGLPEELNMKLTKNRVLEVAHRIKTSPALQIDNEDFDNNVHLINFRDLVYDTNTGTIHPHSPDYLFTNYVDANYSNVSRYNKIRTYSPVKSHGSYLDQLISNCTGGDVDQIKSLQQVTGYIISNEWKAKKFFVLLGFPHTGKSVWLSIWRALIGGDHTTSMSLNQIGRNRFMTAELYKSKLNITAELDENGKIEGTSVIKAITGGDLLTAERKGEDPFHFYGRTKLVAAGNYMPPINKLDGTTAFTDRLHFLMFNHPVPEKKRDKELLTKLLSDNERTEIIRWALDGLEELKEQNFIFTESNEAKKFKLKYIGDLNNVPDFISDMCILDSNNHELKVQRRHLYPTYAEYCKDNGIKALSKSEFYNEIKNLGVIEDKLRMYGSNPLRGFRGLSLNITRTEWLDNNENE